MTYTFNATRTACVSDLSPTVAEPCLTASIAYSIWWIRPYTTNKKLLNVVLGCTPLLAVNTEDMRFQHYCRLLSIISHSATTANRSSWSRNCVHGRSRSNTVHRMLYLVHQSHTHACDRSWLIMAFNRAWWRQWEHYFAVCGISYTSCQHIFYRQKFARELCTGKVTARHQQWRVPLWALALTYTWRSAHMYAVTSHIAASLPLKTSEADEATSCLSALSIIKVSDGVAYTRTVLTAA